MMHEGHEGVTELTKIDYLSAFFDIYTFSTRTKMFFFYQTLHVFDIVNICWKISFLEKAIFTQLILQFNQIKFLREGFECCNLKAFDHRFSRPTQSIYINTKIIYSVASCSFIKSNSNTGIFLWILYNF